MKSIGFQRGGGGGDGSSESFEALKNLGFCWDKKKSYKYLGFFFGGGGGGGVGCKPPNIFL